MTPIRWIRWIRRVCQTRVSSTRNATFASGNTLGRVFGGTKGPCGNGDTHSLGFPFKNTVFSYVKTLGRVFVGHKKRRRQLAPATPMIYQFGRSFSVEITEKSGFPTPAKRVEK